MPRHKTLRLDRDQARKLSIWLRYAADALTARAAELRGPGINPTLADAMAKEAASSLADAQHARELAGRLTDWDRAERHQ